MLDVPEAEIAAGTVVVVVAEQGLVVVVVDEPVVSDVLVVLVVLVVSGSVVFVAAVSWMEIVGVVVDVLVVVEVLVVLELVDVLVELVDGLVVDGVVVLAGQTVVEVVVDVGSVEVVDEGAVEVVEVDTESVATGAGPATPRSPRHSTVVSANSPVACAASRTALRRIRSSSPLSRSGTPGYRVFVSRCRLRDGDHSGRW